MAEKPQPAPAPAQQTPRQLEVFVTTTDLPNVFPAKLEELRKLPELKEFNLVPEAYIDEQGAQAVMKVMSKFIPRNLKLSDEEDTEIPGMPTPDFSIDNGNELALSYGIQNQSTIVYRDPTGAVRLYNLNNEVDKLQRQLARELQDAQPAR